MPGLFCRVCGRNLKNPLSVELGIGPVCRGRTKTRNKNKQGELDFTGEQEIDSRNMGRDAGGYDRTDRQGTKGIP
jgi:hypothetical protein